MEASQLSQFLAQLSGESSLTPQEKNILRLYEATQKKRAVCLSQHAKHKEKIVNGLLACKVTLQNIEQRRLDIRKLRRYTDSGEKLAALEQKLENLSKNEELILKQLEELRKQELSLRRQRLDILQMERVRDSTICRFIGAAAADSAAGH